MSWLLPWTWFGTPDQPSHPSPPRGRVNRDRVYSNNTNASVHTISKERDLIGRTKLNEAKQLLKSIKDLVTTLESLPADNLESRIEPPRSEHDNTNAVPAAAPSESEPHDESLSDDEPSEQQSHESETLTSGSGSEEAEDHSSQSSASKSPGRGLVRGTGTSVSHGDMLWDERRGWVSRTGHEDVLHVELFDAPASGASAALPQEFVIDAALERRFAASTDEHARLGAWIQPRAPSEPDRSYLYLIRTMSIMKMVREVETVRRLLQDSDSDEDVNELRAPDLRPASERDKAPRVVSDKLARFVDANDADEIELNDQPLKLVKQRTNSAQVSFPSELSVDLDVTKRTLGHVPASDSKEKSDSKQVTDSKEKNKRGKGLKLVPAQAAFSDELVFDDEPASAQLVTGTKDLSAFVDEDAPVKSVKAVKSKPASKMKLITLESMRANTATPLSSVAAAAVESVVHNDDEESFDDLELPSGADLKLRLRALKDKGVPRRQSSGHIDNSALEDWCENDDDDVPHSPSPSTHGPGTHGPSPSTKSLKKNTARGVNLLTVK